MKSLRGKTVEEMQAAAREMMAAADRGELTRGDVMNFVIEVGPEVERVCDEYGDTSDRCTNMKNAVNQLLAIAQTLPSGAPSTYGIGTVIGAGLAGMLLATLLIYMHGK
jgi:hypothetical protein